MNGANSRQRQNIGVLQGPVEFLQRGFRGFGHGVSSVPCGATSPSDSSKQSRADFRSGPMSGKNRMLNSMADTLPGRR
jgi:hypothetical protein